jgi:ABC-type tungstate transport system substrate-binding protein
MKTNQEYKNAALASLKGNWAQAIVATFAVLLLSVMANFIVFGSE